MGRGRGVVVAAGACAAALIVAPVAHASQGSDQNTRGDYITYAADPGEANRVVLTTWMNGGLHLNDEGAIIRWIGAPDPVFELSKCTGGVHDVYCLPGAGFSVTAKLGDGNDTYDARDTDILGWLDLGPGDDTARGGLLGDEIDGGPGADDMSGGDGQDGWGDTVTYAHATGPVRVTSDDVADDGQAGEGDNVRSDIESVVGSPFGDVLMARASGSAVYGEDGDDALIGGPSTDTLVGGAGDNTFLVRGGGSDHVYCGPGVDRVIADASDVLNGTCEDVSIG